MRRAGSMNYSGPKHERLEIFQEPIQSHLGAHLGQSILSQLGQLRSYREDFSFNLFIMRAVILRGEGVHPARKHFVFINRKRVVGHIRQDRTFSTQQSSRSYCQTD